MLINKIADLLTTVYLLDSPILFLLLVPINSAIIQT
jgi:hypothetical protein